MQGNLTLEARGAQTPRRTRVAAPSSPSAVECTGRAWQCANRGSAGADGAAGDPMQPVDGGAGRISLPYDITAVLPRASSTAATGHSASSRRARCADPAQYRRRHLVISTPPLNRVIIGSAALTSAGARPMHRLRVAPAAAAARPTSHALAASEAGAMIRICSARLQRQAASQYP